MKKGDKVVIIEIDDFMLLGKTGNIIKLHGTSVMGHSGMVIRLDDGIPGVMDDVVVAPQQLRIVHEA